MLIGTQILLRETAMANIHTTKDSEPIIWELRMEAVLLVMKFERMRVKEGCMLRRSILCLSLSCQMLLKASETSRRITFAVCLLCRVLNMVSWKMRRQGSVRPSTSPKSVLVVIVEVV